MTLRVKRSHKVSVFFIFELRATAFAHFANDFYLWADGAFITSGFFGEEFCEAVAGVFSK